MIRIDGKNGLIEDKRDRQIIVGAFVLVLVAAVFPLFMVETPALGDYLTHLARMHIIASIDKDPQLAQYYTITWHVLPNLAMDLIVPVVSRYVDIYLAGKLFVSLTIALIMTGGMAVHYAVYRRLSMAPLIISLFIYNESLLLGLLNYVFGIGLALWAIAAWIWLRTRHPLLRALVSLGFVLGLFFSHLYSVGLYGLTLLCFEAWMVGTGQSKGRQLISDALVFGLPFLIVFPLLMAAPTMDLASVNIWKPLRLKLRAIQWMFELYHPTLDYAIAAFVGVVVVGGLGRRLLRLHPVGWAILCAGIVVYAAMPTASLFASFYIDYRLPIAVLFMVIPFSRWELNIPATRLFIAAIVGLALLRFTLVGLAWLDIDHAYADLKNAFQEIKPGSSILVGQTERIASPFNKAGPLYYAACLATIERSAFAPNMGTLHSGLFPLTVKPAYRHMAMDPRVGMPKISKFISAAKDPATARAQGFPWADWEKYFDYLLVLYTHNNDTNPLAQKLSILSYGYQFQLYRIKQPKMSNSSQFHKVLLDEGDFITASNMRSSSDAMRHKVVCSSLHKG